jgi:PAS domain S-box-containing protein
MQHQLLIEIVDRAADFIAMADADGCVTYLNSSARRMVGMPPAQDAASTRLFDYHPAWVVDLLRSTGLPEAGRAGSWSAETALLHRDGHEIPVSQTIVAHRDAKGRLRGYSTIARDISERRAHESERQKAEKALQNLAGQLINAQEEERSRIGRELHDHISQRLGVVAIKIDELRNATSARVSGLDGSLEEALQQIDEITGDIHRLSHRLHSATLYDLGLVPAIQRLADEFSERHHLEVECTFSSIPSRLPAAVALCLFRIAEEGLNNVARHSGAASAQVHLARNADGIHLIIADTGVGFDSRTVERKEGLGFVSMRERCRLIDANVLVHSSPSRGTTIGVWVPARSLDWKALGEVDPADRVVGMSRDGG